MCWGCLICYFVLELRLGELIHPVWISPIPLCLRNVVSVAWLILEFSPSIKYCDFLDYAFNILRLIVFFLGDIWERYRSSLSKHTQLTEIAPLFLFQFARFTDDADSFDVVNQTTKTWGLITPKFVISVIGEGEDISQQLSDAITEGLQKITQTTGKCGTRLPQAFWWSLSFWLVEDL